MSIRPSNSDIRQQFEELTLPHRDALYRAARSTLTSNAAAEDSVLETYLQAWKSFHKFQSGTNCRAWLFGILFNVVRHERRKWWSRVCFPETQEVFEKTLPYQPSAGESLTDKEILGALGDIPQAFSEVVILADVEEFSYKEIQAALNIPIGTVMSRLSRGRQLLREKLAHRACELGINNQTARRGEQLRGHRQLGERSETLVV
ncbi:MAG TPA: sigma-70 family RNA polymerase sigma factor [Bryobacteraceae bacterium]|nr:sigma-70 family RNA polymerase sigma factor [Bryobacteraceae bacterium]